jgi:mono/diheme cytochrome c family protein
LSLGLFLASAVILFGAVLTGYALLRIDDPGAYRWAPTLLDRRLGAAAAASLAVACLAGVAAFRLAHAERPRLARNSLMVAIAAAVTVLAARAIELPSTSSRAGFLPKPAHAAATARSGPSGVPTTHVGDAAQGKRIYLGACAACHALDGTGVKGQGQNLRDSTFLKDKSDDKALAFVKTGRQPFDPESKLHLAMPARGGNPSLTDANLLDAIAYVRELEKQATAISSTPKATAAAAAASPAIRATSLDQPQVIDGELWLPHSILPAASLGPTGAASATVALQKAGAEGHAPGNVRRFFSLFLFVNGLLAVYMLFGVMLGIWSIVATARGRASKASLAWVAAYLAMISGIGLLLLPAFYI